MYTLYHFTRKKSDTVYEFWNIKTPSTRIRFQKELTASKTYIYALVRYIDLNLGRGPVKEVARRYQPTLAVCLKDLFCRLGQSQLSRNCELKITPIVVFAIMIQRIFPSWALGATHCTIVIRGLSILFFSLINKVAFSCH